MALKSPMKITILGGGLAGSEAAWQLTKRGVPVRLIEMKPIRYSAHNSPDLGELVCPNSLRSAFNRLRGGVAQGRVENAGYPTQIQAADTTAVPAGKALAVQRDLFSAFITRRIIENPLVTLERGEEREFHLRRTELLLWLRAR